MFSPKNLYISTVALFNMGRNTEIEDKAIKIVMAYERENNPSDRHNDRVGYDIKCSNKIIEVKASTEKSIPFFVLNSSNIKALSGYDNYYVYVVYNILDKPKLMIINKKYIEENKKEKISFEIPLRKQQYLDSIQL